MPISRTRLAVVACAVCGTVVSTAASSVVTASAATPLTIAAVTFTAPPGASLDDPQGIAANNGTIDVSNTADNVVASIVGAATTTIAGSYEATGESGDGGAATAATLDQPTALARDKAGDLFIADTEDNVVREITTERHHPPDRRQRHRGLQGRVRRSSRRGPSSTAPRASPSTPRATSSSPTPTTTSSARSPRGASSRPYAGNGTAGYRGDNGPAWRAELSSPTGLAFDALGNLYIADSGNNVIRRVSTSGVITTVAGDVAADQASGGLGGFSGDGGPATQARLQQPAGHRARPGG